MSSTMMYLHTLSPLHCGTGQGSGIVDLPVVRDPVTTWPEIPGSTIKGVLRDACRDANVDFAQLKILFGPDIADQQNNPSENAGGLWSATAGLLCFPVRSYRGTLAWLTCPHALRRWQRDYRSLGLDLDISIPADPGSESIRPAAPPANCPLAVGENILLEDFDFSIDASHATSIAAIGQYIASAVFPDDEEWQGFFVSRFAVVSDDIFTFLALTRTDVRARIRIDDARKVVADGLLWYEESVPVETIFTLPLRATPRGEASLQAETGNGESQLDILARGIDRPIQLGGKASVGHGIVMARLDRAAHQQGEETGV